MTLEEEEEQKQESKDLSLCEICERETWSVTIEKNNVYIFVCDKCKAVYKKSLVNSLKDHILSQQEWVKRTCEKCGKSYSISWFYRHILEGPFEYEKVCRECLHNTREKEKQSNDTI